MRANIGHIGSALSVADVIAALYGGVLALDGDSHGRDRFILSKGHAALALYAALHLTGQLSAGELDTFCRDGSPLGGHPEHAVPAIDFSTGSLGHGLSIGCGAALAAKLERSPRRVYVLLSDAECNEGSVWEAIMFAAHHNLGQLVAVVDVNRQQALGATSEIIDLDPLARRWEAFGWNVAEVDGHDVGILKQALTQRSAGPTVVLAETVFGRGVSFMERQLEWHYWPLSEEHYVQAMGELGTPA
jgi:transketolase